MKPKILQLVLSGSPTKISRAFLYLMFLCIPLCPIGGGATCPDENGDIVFSVTRTTDLPPNWVMKLSGPWQRLSEKVDLSGLQLNVPCHFYAAKDNIWSPRGQWDIYVWNTNNGAPSRPLARLCLGDPNTVNLEVSGGANGGVVLTVPPEYKISAVHGGGIRICKWEIRTILDAILIRNNSNQVIGTQGDSDVFQFEGTAGDVVRVGVEDDPQSGNNGGQATLRLSGSGINKEQTGTLPMEIVTQLAATGRYEITVEQANENPFRGPYIVWVSSHMGRIRALVPTDSVEE